MKDKTEYYFKEGCYIEEWHNSVNDPEMSIAKVRVQHGQTTLPHKLLATQERYVMLSGRATVWVGPEERTIEVNDVVVIPAGISQHIRNDGDTDLIFLAICTPRFEERNYQQCWGFFDRPTR